MGSEPKRPVKRSRRRGSTKTHKSRTQVRGEAPKKKPRRGNRTRKTTRGAAESVRSAGGAAEAGGAQFQNRVSAWYAVHILAGRLPAQDLPYLGTSLRCQVEQPVDDVFVEMEGGGALYVQAKRSISLSASARSEFASVLDQFVRQYLKCRDRVRGSAPWERPLDPARDRLLLVVGRRAPATITVGLPGVLERVRSTASGTEIRRSLTSEGDRSTWTTVRRHLVTAWKKHTSRNPTEAELVDVVSLIRIVLLDVDPGGRDEHVAQDLVSLTLEDARNSAAAWESLVGACSRFATHRSGRDFTGLLAILGRLAKAPPAFANDVTRLLSVSAKALDRLLDLSVLRLGTTSLKIARPAVRALAAAANEGSLVVVGEPGAGKSGALHDFVSAQRELRRDVILLAADEIAASSVTELSAELGLRHDLDEVLANWPGSENAYLVIDALDAVRGTPAVGALREMIRRVLRIPNSRWRVVVSIRRFDLRYSVELRDLFRGSPADGNFADPDSVLSSVRHVSIPLLSDEELSSVAAQSVELAEVLQSATDALRALLRNAFNLRLVCDLLADTGTRRDLMAITTGNDLLDRYWSFRVLRERLADDREAVLHLACTAMLSSRQLKVERVSLRDRGTALRGLLSDHVLAEWQPSEGLPAEQSTVTFSHHVLFDYAVARLVFDLDVGRVVRALDSDPELALAARPSLVMFFQRLWFGAATRTPFWSAVFAVAGSSVPAIAKLVGPGVAAHVAKSAVDFAPLISALREPGRRALAEQTFAAVVGAVIDAAVVRAAAGCALWSRVLFTTSESLTPAVAWATRLLLADLIERSRHGDALHQELGRAARRLLEFAWSAGGQNRNLVIASITAVCDTYSSDPVESAALLRQALTPERVRQDGSTNLYWLAQKSQHLVRVDPTFVRDLYVATFTYRETSREKTALGDSQILSLTTTRAQDYDMAMYSLAETFPAFVKSSPELAVEAFLSAFEFYIRETHPPHRSEFEAEQFLFDGSPAVLRHDHSSMWDDGAVYASDEPMRLFQAIEDRVDALADVPEQRAELDRIIGKIIERADWAALWRRLLMWGAEHPESVGKRLWSCLASRVVLTAYETHYVCGELLKRLFGLLTVAQRSMIEQAIMDISKGVDAEHLEYAEHERNRLLGCLERTAITTPAVLAEVERLAGAGSTPPNTPPHGPIRVVSRAYTERDYLADEGVPVDDAPNAAVQMLVEPVRAFAAKWANRVPEKADVAAVAEQLRELLRTLASAESSGVHAKLVQYAETVAAEAAAVACKGRELSTDAEHSAFLMGLLLEAAGSEYPAFDALTDGERKFDSASWGSAPRISAAQGLMELAQHKELCDDAIRGAICRLASDAVPAVRFHVAIRLARLWESDRALFRELTAAYVLNEVTSGVLGGVIHGALGAVAPADHLWAGDQLVKLYRRIRGSDDLQQALEPCLEGIAQLDVWRAHEGCRAVMTELLSDVPGNAEHISRILGDLRSSLIAGAVNAPEPPADAARARTVDVFRTAVEASIAYWRQLDSSQFASQDEAVLTPIRGVGRLLDGVAHTLFFAAGGTSDDKDVSAEQLARMYREASPILDALARAPIPSATHYLLQTLEKFVPCDPARVFVRIAGVVVESTRGGYQFEAAGAELAVRLVERFIADHFAVLRSSQDCRRALVDILDVFAAVGWPQARQLTYRLQDIYR